MTIELLARAHKARPFRPFTFRLADGRALLVSYPESLAFDRKGRTVVVADDGGGFEIFDLPSVVSMKFEGEPDDSGK